MKVLQERRAAFLLRKRKNRSFHRDQKALVTGATSGLGRAIAFQLVRDGAEVMVHGRDAARGIETIEAISASFHTVHVAKVAKEDENGPTSS